MEVVETRKSNDTDLTAIKTQIEALAGEGKVEELQAVVEQFARQCPEQGDILLAEGLLAFVKQQPEQCLGKMRQARDVLDPDHWPELTSMYSSVLLQSQLALPRRERPAASLAYNYYKKNIAALREVDEALAQEVQRSSWPENVLLLELWNGLYICDANRTVLVSEKSIVDVLAQHVEGRAPIAFAALGSGHELRYALEHRVNILHGMARAHYLFEPSAPMIRVLLHMFDVTEVLRSEELLIFGGNNMQQRIEEVFGSLRYALPAVRVGNRDDVEQYIDPVKQIMVRLSPVQEAKAYYASDEFRSRQRQIARGEVLPRVLVDTCRWTTFLKYCAADFEKAFAGLGCQTRYLIEENDVQNTLPGLQWRELEEFKPDFIFMVSHARPSAPYLPRELPFIGFIQDKCGPMLRLDDLSEHISRQDLFVSGFRAFQSYIEAKGVPHEQIFVMPIPADETMFHPVDDDRPADERFASDIGFVKHGHAHAECVQQEFLEQRFRKPDDGGLLRYLEGIFEDLYKATCFQGEKRQYEGQMQQFVAERLAAGIGPELRQQIAQFVSQFYIVVYSAAWRCQFLEAIDQAGLQLSLYGGGWNEHARLAHLYKGPVARGRELNYVYNFNRINLSINHSATAHQRLSECGLAGGFMMVADHALDEDWEPARQYFAEDREVVFFDTKADLIDKCRYYLAHDDQRREIALNMHRRAVTERTCRAGAETVLSRWRELLLLRANA